MYRQTNYPWQEPFETDFLLAQRFGYEGLGLLALDLLGSTTLASGLACTPTGPASMSVQIGPGRLYSKQNLEPTAWGQLLGVGGLLADTLADHQILKQGLYRDTTVLAAMVAPVTVGQSQNYLIQAAFSEVDAIPQSLPFVSSVPPYPPIAPSSLNTVRQDLVVITVKAGTPAATGTQTTPAPDAGNVGLWVVTIAQGQTSITSGNISAYGSAPFITETLTQKISKATADALYIGQTFADARYLQQAAADARYAQLSQFTQAYGAAGSMVLPSGFKLQWTGYSMTPTHTNNTPTNTKWDMVTVSWPSSFASGLSAAWGNNIITTNGNFRILTLQPTFTGCDVYASCWDDPSVGLPITGTVFGIGH